MLIVLITLAARTASIMELGTLYKTLRSVISPDASEFNCITLKIYMLHLLLNLLQSQVRDLYICGGSASPLAMNMTTQAIEPIYDL